MRFRCLIPFCLLVLAGCASAARQSAGSASGSGNPSLAPPALPAPSALPHRTSLTPGLRYLNGADYELALPSSRVTVVDTTLSFSAQEPAQSLSDYAFALYGLDLSVYSGSSLLGLDWQGGSAGAGSWVGLANWGGDRWDWQTAPATAETDIGAYTDYVRPGDGAMYIAILTSTAQANVLSRVYFGTPPLEAPQNLLASDGDYTDKVALSWEAPAGGPLPDSYTVQRSDTQGGPYADLGSSASLGYDDLTAVPGLGYWYQVISTKAGEAPSPPSNEDSGYSTLPLPGWTVTLASTVGPTQDPIFISLALDAGNPAIVYNRNSASYGVYFVRAQDAVGSSWASTQDLALPNAKEPSLGFFGGVPVISYTDGFGDTDIFLRQALNVDGTAWGLPITVDDLSGAHPLTDSDLADVGGRPAVAFKHSDFQDNTGTELCFLRSNDDLGNSWPPDRSIPDASGVAWNPQLGVLAGDLAAIAYGLSDKDFITAAQVKFVRATDPTGIAWAAPVPVADLSDTNVIPQVQLVLAEGNPAVFYYDYNAGGGTLYYKRANDALGTDWPTDPLTLRTGVTFYDGATLVNGHPAVAFLEVGDTQLSYREAANNSGSAWLPAELVETDLRGLGAPTMQAFGLPQHPCIAYRANRIDLDNPGEVRFARRN